MLVFSTVIMNYCPSNLLSCYLSPPLPCVNNAKHLIPSLDCAFFFIQRSSNLFTVLFRILSPEVISDVHLSVLYL